MSTTSLVNTYELTFDADTDMDKIEKIFETSIFDNTFEYIEFVPVIRTFDIPNDPQTNSMWYIPTVEANKARAAGADQHNGK